MSGSSKTRVLHPALFVRRNGHGAVVYARRRSCPEFYDLEVAVTAVEVACLRHLDGSRSVGAAVRAAVPRATAAELRRLHQFVEWAEQLGILVPPSAGCVDGADSLDPRLLAAPPDGSRPSGLPGTRREWPVFFTFMPTLRCQTNCAYCYLGQRSEPRPPLPFSRVRELVAECRGLCLFQWRLTGGEALLYPHLTALLTELRQHGLFLGRPISTKIPVAADRLRELRAAGLVELQFSLDGVDPSIVGPALGRRRWSSRRYVHDMLGAIRMSHELGLETTVRPTVTRRSLGHLPTLLNTLASLGELRVVVGVVVADGSTVPYSEALSRADWLAMQDTVALARERHPALHIDMKAEPSTAEFAEEHNIGAVHYPDTATFVKHAYCPMNRVRMCVLPDGRVAFCPSPSVRQEVILGDLSHQSIEEVWSSETALALAYPAREDCPNSPCARCDDFERCHYDCGKCLALVAGEFGARNLHYPDPRCPRSAEV